MSSTGEESKYLSRKWMLSIGIQISATVALALRFITEEVYGEITVAVIISYSFANAAAFFGRGRNVGNSVS